MGALRGTVAIHLFFAQRSTTLLRVKLCKSFSVENLLSDGAQCLIGLLASGAPPVEASTKRSEHFEHILNQIIFDLGLFYYEELSPLGSQCGLHILGPEMQEAVTMFDHKGLNVAIGQQA